MAAALKKAEDEKQVRHLFAALCWIVRDKKSGFFASNICVGAFLFQAVAANAAAAHGSTDPSRGTRAAKIGV
jgi:hypothetical protein